MRRDDQRIAFTRLLIKVAAASWLSLHESNWNHVGLHEYPAPLHDVRLRPEGDVRGGTPVKR